MAAAPRLRRGAGCGVPVADCELIGLVPAAVFEDTIRHYLQVPGFSVKQVIESRLLEDRPATG